MIDQLDLKQLRFLVNVHETGSVSLAGQRIGLSQPASSNVLARLREALGDPLFVRGKNGMSPTAFAESAVPKIRAHLAGISDALSDAAHFDPASSTRTFRLSLSGLGEQIFIPPLARHLSEVAPGVRLETASVALADLPRALFAREVDIAIGILKARERVLRELHLFQDDYRVVGKAGLNADENTHLNSKKIVLVAPSATYAGDIEQVIAKAGLSDNICYRLRHFGALPDLLSTLDAVSIVPGQLATRLSEASLASILPVRLTSRRRTIRLLWHRKTEHEPDCIWLRNVVCDLFQQDPRFDAMSAGQSFSVDQHAVEQTNKAR